jgi:hypothetical protein
MSSFCFPKALLTDFVRTGLFTLFLTWAIRALSDFLWDFFGMAQVWRRRKASAMGNKTKPGHYCKLRIKAGAPGVIAQ